MKLEHIAIITAIVSLSALFFLSHYAKVEEREINSLLCRDIGKEAVVSGEIAYIDANPNTTFLAIKDDCKLQIIYYSYFDAKKGDYLQAKGKIGAYNGNVELKADSLRLLK